jgi:hypothetical protein
VSDAIHVPGAGIDQLGRQIVDKVRVRVTAAEPGTPVFVGLARSRDAGQYLDGVQHTTIRDIGGARAGVLTKGTKVPALPASMPIWKVSSAGQGTQAIVTTITRGVWKVVVMKPDASPGLTVRADVGATAPDLPWVAASLLALGALASAGGVLLIVIAVRRSSGASSTGAEQAELSA